MGGATFGLSVEAETTAQIAGVGVGAEAGAPTLEA